MADPPPAHTSRSSTAEPARTEQADQARHAAATIFARMSVGEISDLDLSYAPPLGSSWDAVKAGARAGVRATAARQLTSGLRLTYWRAVQGQR